MRILKPLFDFYLNGSIHVALSVYALVQMTQFMFQLGPDWPVDFFAFFGTITGYNFVKYDALSRTRKSPLSNQVKAIAVLSFFSFLAAAYFFFQLQRLTQQIGLVFLLLTLLYTLPFFPNRKNARNWAGIKIYMVALCWVGVTLILPVINAEIAITSDFYLKCIQRFILVFVLILVFEIIDLKYDDPHLQTVPQQIGVARTKWLGCLLLVVFCGLEVFNAAGNDSVRLSFVTLPLQLVIALIVALFLLFAHEKKSKYYTAFWVESIPVFWWLLVVLFAVRP